MAFLGALTALLIWATVTVEASTPRKGVEEEGCRQRREVAANLFAFPRVGKRMSLDYPIHLFPIIRWGHVAAKKTSETAQGACDQGLWFGPRLGKKRAEEVKEIKQPKFMQEVGVAKPPEWKVQEYDYERDGTNYRGST